MTSKKKITTIALEASKTVKEAKRKDFLKVAKSIYDQTPKERNVINKETGISIGFHKQYSRGELIYGTFINRNYLIVLENLRMLMREAKFSNKNETVSDKKLKKGIVAFVNLYNHIEINGKIEMWWFNVAVDKSGNFYYQYAINKQKPSSDRNRPKK